MLHLLSSPSLTEDVTVAFKQMKILIIKFSAIGDVLRTTTLLHGLKRKWPGSEILWVTSPEAIDLLKENSFISEVVAFDKKTAQDLKKHNFDLLICMDKEEDSTALAMRLKAKKKIGFGRDDKDKLTIFNKESRYAYELGISDELKFKINKKTYPEIIYEMCGLDYKKDRYVLNLTGKELAWAESRLKELGIKKGDFIFGLNTGAGTRFTNKIWSFEKHKALIGGLLEEQGIKILLLGGKREECLNNRLKDTFKSRIYSAGCDNTLREFASIVKYCDVVISGDTLAMHIGIALDRYVIAVFGPTCSQEIELYGNGEKIVSDMDCSPCYKKKCTKKHDCMSVIDLNLTKRACQVSQIKEGK